MELIPAIDILDGNVVRLSQGDYDQVTVYDHDPGRVATEFEQAGARRVHVVDLDGARDGEPRNTAAIERILSCTELSIQIGGGIRNADIAKRWYDAGAARVVMGTAAVRMPEAVQQLCEANPDGVVVAIDARQGDVAVEGWLKSSGRSVEEFAIEVDSWNPAAILYTNIERDGTREGPDVQGTQTLQERLRATVIASGGIGSLAHLKALARANVRATVCGRALYSGAFSLPDAFAAAEGS